MVATGGRVTTAGFALTVIALLLPGLAYATAVLSQTAARSVAAVKPVTTHQPAAAARPVPARRSVTAALRGPGARGCHSCPSTSTHQNRLAVLRNTSRGVSGALRVECH
jgi:hypothetical protein